MRLEVQENILRSLERPEALWTDEVKLISVRQRLYPRDFILLSVCSHSYSLLLAVLFNVYINTELPAATTPFID
jgi:hypothetical protein